MTYVVVIKLLHDCISFDQLFHLVK